MAEKERTKLNSTAMTKIDLHEFDLQRGKLVSGLVACAEQLRNTAQVVEDFAQLINGLDGEVKGKRKELVFEDGDGTKKRKRTSKPKDPNAPKRPASSYILFQNEIRSELRQQFPQLTNPELLTMISEKWKHMSDQEKDQYNQTMLRLKAQYSEEKKAYDNRSPEEIEAANKATAEAAATKKASRGSRSKPKDAAPVEAVQARPPPPESDEDAEAAESDVDDSDVDSHPPLKPPSKKQPESSDNESDSSEEDSEPVPKRSKRTGSVQPSRGAKKIKA